jgi:23S rRNA pseudouridine955/2504/2580 synthase
VNGGRAKPETRVGPGDQVRVPPLPDAAPREDKGGLGPREVAYAKSLVIYEDDEVLAINKPSGLAVQGGTKTKDHVDRLLSAWGEGLERPRLVHRLDRDTSGVLVLGKTPAATAKLAGAFARRRTEKIYWALVMGLPKPSEGVLELPLVKRGVGDRELMVPADPKDPQAETAETEFVTLARAADKVAWMALWPHTGRTHQLRAHMLAMGHPILGDPKYKTDAATELAGGLKLQLHARRLTLPHPSRGSLVLEAPISPEMKAGFARFGFDAHEADPEPFARRKRR